MTTDGKTDAEFPAQSERVRFMDKCRPFSQLSQTLLWLFLVGLAILVTSCRPNRVETNKLAVASAYGQLTGFLLSSNSTAAYEMMSTEFRKAHSLAGMEARIQHKGMTSLFADCDLDAGASVRVNGMEAVIRIKYNKSFRRAFYFRKESGHWRFTDRTSDFESSKP